LTPCSPSLQGKGLGVRSVLALFTFFTVLFFTARAHADAPFVTLLAGARADYRFDYRGDKTTINVAVDTQGVENVELLIYTPAQIDAAKRGAGLMSVGRGTRGNGYDLFWTGNFNALGVYHVVVANHSPGPILYRLAITGESVSGVAQIVADAPQTTTSVSSQNGRQLLTVALPPGAGITSLRLNMPSAPTACTHANEISPIISTTIKLCANEIYPPLHLIGNNLALFSDNEHSAIISSVGRQFALTAEGANNWIDGVTIQASADARDLGAFLCQYDECVFSPNPRDLKPGVTPSPLKINGGILYGGGILLKGSNSTIHAVTVRGGTIGIAMVNGRANNLIDNQLNDLNGWGSFNVASVGGYFVGNTLNRENHGCTTPDGFKFEHGCETAGWVCLACSGNVVARNHCELSANCFYLSGERGLASNNNKLIANYCAGATDNCFELTFSRGNILQDNIATADVNTSAACNYPFWIGGSTVYFKNNNWQCAVSSEDALARAKNSTAVPTVALLLGATNPSTSSSTSTTATPTSNPSRRTPPEE
jgi:hypothetical protein